MNRVLILVSIFFSFGFAGAQDEPSFVSTENVDEIAQKRLYPGGIDEEPLRVQADVYVPYSIESPTAIKKKVYQSFLEKKKAEEDTNNE